ncbi:MAG: DUF1501 domain-containing protein [Pirellulales bacterium]
MSIFSHVPSSIVSRRDLLTRTGMGLGAVGLTQLLGTEGLLVPSARAATTLTPLVAKPPQFAPRAKHVIHIFLNGGCSHIDTFDPKPALEKHAGKEIPNTLRTERKTGAALPSPYKFRKFGQSGIEVSEIFPQVGQVIDNFTVLRSLHADVPNHEPSLLLMNCGDARLVRPSMGSWVTYGLGTENQNLPAFIAMCPGGYPIQESQNWQSGFLPGVFQGTYVDSQHTDLEKLIANIRNHHQTTQQQREQLDLVRTLNEQHLAARGADPQLESRVHSFELAYRMQQEAADAFDVSREPQHVLDAYGQGHPARQILIARRLIERGVRFVQLWHGNGQPWDNHDDLAVNHRRLATEIDGAIAALIRDLKSSGLLDETLVMIAGEFGRTPTVELPASNNAGKVNGRDHNHYGFTMLLAGGGVKEGFVYGATDEFGFQAVENKVHIHDLHATILYLLGFDHEKFTYRYAGRDFRLTDVHGRVVHDLIA